jgi:hypothetical protein
MNSPVMCQPTLRVNADPSLPGPSSLSVCCLGPDVIAFLASCPQPADLLKSIFRVTVAQAISAENENVPDVSGRYILSEDEVRFIPHFRFESYLKYRATFDPRPLGSDGIERPLTLDFVIPSDQRARAFTRVTHIFPSCGLLPENLLRFYVCFSNSMQRGRALEEISLFDSDGQPVADALYRPPVELWDRTMRYLTVLLDPGRLKRWVGPNVELGPPLKAGQKYTFEIRSGMTDLYGRRLRESFRKDFLVGEPVREHIAVEDWKILRPQTDSREALVITFPHSLDWILLLRTITIRSADGSVIDGQIAVDECESRWSFAPTSSWVSGLYHIDVEPGLEDVCGNSINGPFDRPLGKNLDLVTPMNGCSLTFHPTCGGAGQ